MRFGLVIMFAAVLAGTGFSQEPGEWYQGKPIRNIVFEGLRHVDASEMEGITEPYIGRAFNDDVFWELQGQLYSLEYFDVISPTAVPADPLGTEVIIRFVVTERPIVSRITFVGNDTLRRAELMEAITLKVNDVVNQLKLRLDEMALVNKYLEKGFPDVRIRSESQANADSTMTVTFFITEGDRTTIEEFLFEGNRVFSDRALRGQLSLKTKGILNDGAFQEAKLVADRNAITQYYHDRGYIDAKVTDVVRNVRRDEKGNNSMAITFLIDEGRIYTFGGITFEGNRIFPTEQLEALIYSRTGDTVNARRVEADLQRIMNLYYENGYIFNTINPEETRNTGEGVLSFHITIVERGRAHIENIIVRGNKKTKDEVILREIPLEPGDVFSRTKVIDGIRNLYNLQFFSTNILPETPQGSTDSLMDLVINVEEQPTTDVQVGLTFSGSSDPDVVPISLMLKLSDRNFLGYGNMVGGELNVAPDAQTFALEYTQRWLFGLPLSGGFDFTLAHSQLSTAMDNLVPLFNGDEPYAYPDGFLSYEDYLAKSKLPPNEYRMAYEQWNVSLGFSTGYRFSTALGNLGLGGGVRTGLVRNSYDADLFRPFDYTLRERNNSWTPATSFSLSVSLDQRDIYYDPSTGYYGIQRMGYYGVLPGTIEREHYIRTDTKLEGFVTLFDIPVFDNFSFKAVFGVHTGLSFIFPQFGYATPLIEDANKLAVDGMFVGRGWSGQRLNRGLALWENWAEIRFPVVPGILALDLFFDGATKKETPQDFFATLTWDDMLYSFGGGLRFTIPQFPFRFSFAKRFKTENGQVQWQSGPIGRTNEPGSGIDFVISFALSTY
jgi:outer membrane protein insertion porin family